MQLTSGLSPRWVPMHVELLRMPPISGTVPERHFDVSARSNAWVQFEDAEGGTWVGVFGRSGLAPFNNEMRSYLCER